MLKQADSRVMGKVAMIMWQLWKSRNDKVWSNVDRSYKEVIHQALDYLYSWLEVRTRAPEINQSSPSTICDIEWRRPDPGYVKCNIDATLVQNKNGIGFGMIL